MRPTHPSHQYLPRAEPCPTFPSPRNQDPSLAANRLLPLLALGHAFCGRCNAVGVQNPFFFSFFFFWLWASHRETLWGKGSRSRSCAVFCQSLQHSSHFDQLHQPIRLFSRAIRCLSPFGMEQPSRPACSPRRLCSCSEALVELDKPSLFAGATSR